MGQAGDVLLGYPTALYVLKWPGLLRQGGWGPFPRKDHGARPKPCQLALETELAAPQELHVSEKNGFCVLDSSIGPRALGRIPGPSHRSRQAPHPIRSESPNSTLELLWEEGKLRQRSTSTGSARPGVSCLELHWGIWEDAAV